MRGAKDWKLVWEIVVKIKGFQKLKGVLPNFTAKKVKIFMCLV